MDSSSQPSLSGSFVICSAAVAPLRSEPREASEMVNQLLLGETARVLEEKPRWLRVAGLHDGYEGWLSITQAFVLSQAALPEWRAPAPQRRNSSFLLQACTPSGQQILIPAGAVLPEALGEPAPGQRLDYPFGRFEVMAVLPGNPAAARDAITAYTAHAPKEKAGILHTALLFAGAPYLWGGRSVFGIDCSGFIQIVLQMHGYASPRDASQQVNMPDSQASLRGTDASGAHPGDIIYFSFDGINVVHVGFYAGGGLLLHASGTVKLEYIDEVAYKRKVHTFAFNERLAQHIYAVQHLR